MTGYEFSMKCLQEMARMTKADITPFALTLYEEELEKHGWDNVAVALKKMFNKLKRFPTVEDIEAELGITQPDEKDEANEIVARCIEAIRKFGYAQPKEAAAYIGPIGWAAINAIGSWDSFTETKLDDMNTTRAQLRDMCKAKKAMASVGRIELPDAKKEELSDARSDILTLVGGILDGKQSDETGAPF